MKSLAPEMAATYDPAAVESGWYPWWEKSGFFRPASDTKPETTAKPFVIVAPPPNVTGFLHLGHALTGAVQDTLTRFHRMKGDDTLYVPGTDHAGIATQVVVERRVMKTEGKSRHELGREEFTKRLWDYKENHAGMITKQFRKIGVSTDWTRERFTMDSQSSAAVVEAFVRLHEDGLVHRDTRLVNWCCSLQSAISDLEVEFVDVLKTSKMTIPGYERKVDMGVLTHVAYKLSDSDEEIIIATTRPETLLGDVAVAVHPDDERYKRFHGKTLKCPFRDATIPIVLDSTLVDINFGTGAVKITPAHDPNDFEAGKRHNLPQLVMMDLNGHVTMEPFKGIHRFDCRREIVKKLEEMGLLRGVEPYEYRVGRCERTGDIVEPMLMPQWFVDCSDMARRSVEAVRNGELRLYPASHESVWFHWLENIKPWCVSRQLWWGHRIPAYKVVNALPSDHADPWVVARNLDEAKAKAKTKFNLTDEQLAAAAFEQDPDVLDTWFSSGLWPFSTLGWPNDSSDMQRFFPNSLMETGHDIIFFWVARMVMLSLHLTGKLPFTEVFLHAMVRDKNGEKMSKSKGNVIDPLYVINGVSLETLNETVRNGNLSNKELEKAIKQQKEFFPEGIPECGSDALRFGLLSYTQSGRSVNLDIQRIVAYRQFCNKLWNVVRYVLYHALGTEYVPSKQHFEPAADAAALPLECRWILSRLDVAINEATQGMSEGQYDLALATNAVYRFWLYELCDVFLELTKPTIQNGGERKQLVQDVLLYVVEKALRLLHPMMPFVTEELWHRLPNYSTFAHETIMLSPYPEVSGWSNSEVEASMSIILDVVHNVRSTKASYSLTNKHKPEVWITAHTPELRELFAVETLMVSTLGVVGEVKVIAPEEEAKAIPKGCGFSVVTKEVGVNMMLMGFIDADKEVAKLEKQLAGLTKQIEGTKKKMSIPNYETKVPEEIRLANTEKLHTLEMQETQLRDGLEKMRSLK
ncbi:putative Valyl-tRNA synthetase [Leptomonas seymouri]|uniref:Valine--tRNA ligase, mitochondrial n=1 Tax=Leptomonas seymouri TaxID=5684 RepID=A0A0N1IKP0_LEPSE|nr:putative Valyl-tRNA synthetase [Leptomonas seymouri]|eukprot:KPI87024.1 putative Valyl-tRNA synthetase [Leptomonas seymouri]